MTRFARAKGSKASNERIPEPATPWHEMKTQLMNKYKEQETSSKKEEADERRTKTYENFLKEKQEEDAKNIKWAEFPGVQKKTKKKLNEKKKIKNVVKNGLVEKEGTKRKSNDDDNDDDGDEEFQSLKRKLEEKLKEFSNVNTSDDEAPEEISAKVKPKEPIIKKQKVKKDKLTISVNGNATEEETAEEAAKRKAERKLERRKQQRLKKREALQGKSLEEMTEEDQAKVEKLKQKLLARRQKRRELKDKRKAEKAAQQPPKEIKPLEELTDEERVKREKNKQKALARKQRLKQLKEKKKIEEATKSNQQSPKPKKPLEEMTEDERAKVEKHRRKKLAQKEKRDKYKQENKQFDETTKNKQKFEKSRKSSQVENVTINGQDVQLARYNGFPVRKEDYDRLVELEKEMRIKGVPRDEIKRAMKLEQRRAEKALARLKKKVCFHCRRSGHNLSECPLLSDQNQYETINSGICFKCGSTEHTHFNCRVVRGDEYKFATCFICKEQGHISRQCPDNNRGLYPQGGACRVCGDVTHLKKDCPRYQAQQEQNTVLAETMNNGNVEGLEEEVRSESPKKKKFNKVVKF